MLRCYIVYYNKDCGRYRGRNVLRTHKHTHTDKHSSDFISVQCHELHWTDKNFRFITTCKAHRSSHV